MYATEKELKRIEEINNEIKPLKKEKSRILARIRQRKWEKETRNKEVNSKSM